MFQLRNSQHPSVSAFGENCAALGIPSLFAPQTLRWFAGCGRQGMRPVDWEIDFDRLFQDKLTNFDKKFVNFLLYKISSIAPQRFLLRQFY